MKVELAREVDENVSAELYRGLAPTSFFQTPLWLKSLSKAFKRFEPFWIVLRGDGGIRAFMPFIKAKRVVFHTNWSMPFGTYGGPVAHSPEEEKILVDEFFRLSSSPLCLKAHVVMFKSGLDYEIPEGVHLQQEVCHVVDISGGFEHYWDKLIRKKRRQLYRKGLREGVVVRKLRSRGELDYFYRLYQENSLVWGGVHPYPKLLFEELFSSGSEDVLFLGGFLDGRLIAGHLLFFSPGLAQAWQAAVSEEAYSYYLSEILIVEGIREACRRGIGLFNLGSSGGSEGIAEFKASMGGERFQITVLKKERF